MEGWAYVSVRRRIDGQTVEVEDVVPDAELHGWVKVELLKPGQLLTLRVEDIEWLSSTRSLGPRGSPTSS